MASLSSALVKKRESGTDGSAATLSPYAPNLWPKTSYGMPAYAPEGHVVCFFQSAKLDDGDLWPTSLAPVKLTPVIEKTIRELVKKAVD